MKLVTNGRRWMAGLMAGAAIISMAAPVAADGVPTPTPKPSVVKRCIFSGRTPEPGSTVTTSDVLIALTVACNKPVGKVSVFLDGVQRMTEGLGPDVFHDTEFFTALNLANGTHRVRVVVQGNGSTSWTFKVNTN